MRTSFVPAAVAVLLFASCSSLPPRAQRDLELFDTYWQALADDYPFFTERHLDWNAIGAQYRAAMAAVAGPTERYHLLAAMLSELQDPHVSLEIPIANWRDEGAPGDDGAPDAAAVVPLTDAPGLVFAPCQGRLFVQSWPAGAAPTPPDHLRDEAAEWPEVVAVEGSPVALSLLDVLMLGPPGSPVELHLRWSDGTLSRHVVARPERPRTAVVMWQGKPVRVRVDAPATTFDELVAFERRGRFGWVRIDTLARSRVELEPLEFVARLDRILDSAATTDGIVLDLRQNGGGDAAAALAIAGRFLAAPQLTVLATEQQSWLFGLVAARLYGSMVWVPRPPRIERPLVVLTSWRTGSAAEHLARRLQIACGAVVVGERTAGAEAFLETVEGPDGSVLRFGRQRAMETTGRGLQGDGVVPDIAVLLTIDDVRRSGSFAAARADWERRLQVAAEAALTARVR